jgi:hypothetical protein
VALHISGDDRPGFAILDFERDIGSEDLTITLKSKLLHFGEYLSSEGTWAATPCFFKATRLPGKGQGVYQIGPEIVNRGSLALDFIEVSVPGAEIVEDVTWPVLPADPNAVPVHAVATAPPESAPAKEPESAANLKPADVWDEETQDAEAEEDTPAPEAAAIEPEPVQSLEPPESLAAAREEDPQEPEAGDAGPSPEAAVIEPEPANSSEPPESFAEAQAQNTEEPGPEKAEPSLEAQAVKPQSTKGSEPMQKPERERTNDMEPAEDQKAKARSKEELVRWLEALPRGSAFSPENGNTAKLSSEKLEMELGAPPRGYPSTGPRPSEPQDGPAGRQMSGSATVLELLPGEHNNRQPWAWYGLSAAAALGIALLIFSAWLFCIPYLGIGCKSGGGFDAAVSCARGGSLDACGIGLAGNREAEAPRSHEAAARERAKAEAAMREMLRAEAEERQVAEAAAQERANAEAAAREMARREAGERQAAEAAAQERAKVEAAAREKARLEAEERDRVEKEAREKAAQAAQVTALASLNMQQPPALAAPEGNYIGRTVREENCAPVAKSVIVTIKGGKVCWEHDLNVSAQWAGTVDPAGAVAARVPAQPGTSAAGQVVNGGAMSIDMTYPECANPIRIKLINMIGAASPCP